MLLDFPASRRAPGRGRYTRAHSAGERFREQRARLLRATAIAYLDGEPSVTRVAELSGVGRNTFYECFDDFKHALDAVRRDELCRVQRGIAGSSEGSVRPESVTELCRVWLELVALDPLSALVALEPVRGQISSGFLAPFRDALARLLPRAAERRDAALLHAAACAETSARALALALLRSSPAPLLAALVGDDANGSASTEPARILARSVQRLVGG
jgi:hypothetical protein